MSTLTPPDSSQTGSPAPATFTIGLQKRPGSQKSGAGPALTTLIQTFMAEPQPITALQIANALQNGEADPPFLLENVVDILDDVVATEPEYLLLMLVITTKWPELEFNCYATAQKILSSAPKFFASAHSTEICALAAQIASSNEYLGRSEIMALCRSALDFLASEAQGKLQVGRMVVSIYKGRSDLRKALLDLVLYYLRKGNQYTRDFYISKYSAALVNFIPYLLCHFIQISGSLELASWDEAVAYNRRTTLAEQCQERVQATDAIANTIVKTCVELSPSETVNDFVDDILNCVSAPETCASELIVRCICATLLVMCKNFRVRHRFPPPYVFEMLGKVQRTLYTIFAAPASNSMGPVIDYLVTSENRDAAFYLATLDAAQTNAANYKDFHLRFTTPQTRVAAMVTKRWFGLLKTQKIGKMYENTVDVMLLLSESGVPGPAYIEILKSLALVVFEHPSFFRRIEPHLIKQMENASSQVCDLIAHIISNYLAATKLTFTLVSRVMIKAGAPGNLAYKRRCIKLLDTAYQSNDKPLQTLAWKYLLVLSDDSKSSIAQLAAKQLCEYIETSDVERLCGIFEQILTLGHKFSELICGILRRPMQKKAIHGFVAYLLSSLDDEPNYLQLKVAALFISANGLYLPPSKVPILVHLSVSSIAVEHRLIILHMLKAALTTKPRIILSPKLVAQLDKKMKSLLVVYTETELEYAGRIIHALADIGRVEEKTQRRAELEKIYGAAVAALKPSCSASVLSHLIPLVSIGSRVWVKSYQCIDKLFGVVDTGSRLLVVRALCRICTEFPNLFLEGRCHKFFQDHVFGDISSPEWAEFMAVFLEFLEGQDLEGPHEQRKLTMSVLHGNDKSLVAESTLDGLFQMYFPALETCALASNDKTAATAARLLCKGIIANKVDSFTVTATIVRLCYSSNVEISQTAQECLGVLVGRQHLTGFAKGMLQVSEYPVAVFRRLWEILESGDLDAVTSQLLEHIPQSRGYALAVFNGLVAVNMKPADARALEQKLDNTIYTFSGAPEFEVLLIVLKATIQYKYAEGATKAMDLVDAAEVMECGALVDRLRDCGDFEAVFEVVAAERPAMERDGPVRKQRRLE